MRDPTMTKLDFVSSIFLMLFGAVVLVESWRMPRFEDQAASIYSAPGLVPGVLAIVLLLCGFIIFVRSILHGGWRLGGDGSLRLGAGARNVLITVVISSIYVLLLIGRMPFWLATTIYGFTYTTIFEYRSKNPPGHKLRLAATGLLVALAVALAINYVFERIFLVRMP